MKYDECEQEEQFLENQKQIQDVQLNKQLIEQE